MTIKVRKLVWTGAASLVAILLIGSLLASDRINVIRICGPVQSQMQQTSDLFADILPPPEYVLEPFFEATLLMREPGEYTLRAKRLAQLKKDYDDRHAYWVASNLDPILRNSVTQGSHAPAVAFWAELTESFLPAVKAQDSVAMNASYRRVGRDYSAHRTMVDRSVALASDYQTKLKAHADSQLNWAIALLIALAAAIVAFVAAACVVLLHYVVGPLTDVVGATTILACGGSAVVPHQTRQDELGEMAGAVEMFRAAAQDRVETDARAAAEQHIVTVSLRQSLSALSEGDLTCYISEDFPDGYVVLKTSFNDALDAMRTIIQLVSESASQINAGSSEIAQASEDLARRTESNAASLEQTSAALVQVEDRIKTTSVASDKTVARADQAITTVQSGRSTADHAVLAMDRVSESAKGIDNVIEGLDKIAFQTRVLAMNAAVEAGRAGDAGRGFAVVADLVSALAMRAEEEAKRARDQLTVTQTEIISAVYAVKKVDGALADIAGDVDAVHRLLGSMASDNQAQALAITEITAAIGTMDKSTQQNAAMVEETSAATRHLSSEVKSLAERAAIFKFEHRIRKVAVAHDRRGLTEPAIASIDVLPIRSRDTATRFTLVGSSSATATAGRADF